MAVEQVQFSSVNHGQFSAVQGSELFPNLLSITHDVEKQLCTASALITGDGAEK
jgi:hypothetical protein